MFDFIKFYFHTYRANIFILSQRTDIFLSFTLIQNHSMPVSLLCSIYTSENRNLKHENCSILNKISGYVLVVYL